MSKTEFQSNETNINHLLRNISQAFGVSSGLFDFSGRQLGCCSFEGRSNLCCFIHNYDATQICRQSYLQGFCECMEKEEPLVYFCPFGLVNVIVAVPSQYPDLHFITMGPLLYHTPDDEMISNILGLNFLLKPRAREIRQYLSEVPVKSEAQVYSLIEVLSRAIRGTALFLNDSESPKQDRASLIKEDLRLWLNANPYQNDTNAFRQCLSELLPSEEEQIEFCNRNFERVIKGITDFIFKASRFELMIHRSIKYIEFLMDMTKKNDLPMEDFFNNTAIDVEKIKNASDPAALECYIVRVSNLFLTTYYAHREVHNKSVIFRAMHYIRTHYSDISLSDVAEYVCLNPAYFSNLFKKSMGQSYSSYLNKIRIEESKRLLRKNLSLAETAQRVGFSDQSYFTNVFKKCEGISPNRWKQEQKQEQDKGKVIF